jgi:hypothetical protein
MRFIMMVVPKGYESATPGTMPDADRVAAVMRYNGLPTEGWCVTRARRTASAVDGRAFRFPEASLQSPTASLAR